MSNPELKFRNNAISKNVQISTSKCLQGVYQKSQNFKSFRKIRAILEEGVKAIEHILTESKRQMLMQAKETLWISVPKYNCKLLKFKISMQKQVRNAIKWLSSINRIEPRSSKTISTFFIYKICSFNKHVSKRKHSRILDQ